MKKTTSSVYNLFKLISKFEPYYPFIILFKLISSFVITLMVIYFPKIFIEQLISDIPYRDIAQTIFVYVFTFFALNGINIICSGQSEITIDRFTKKLQFETGKITMELPLEEIEGANFIDELRLANNADQIVGISELIQKIALEAITISGLAAIVIQLDFSFIMLVCITLGIKILLVYMTYRHNKKRRKDYAANDRIGDYLSNLAYFYPGASKELRINNLQDWFMKKIKVYRDVMLKLQYGDFKKHAFFECINATVLAIQSFVILLNLALRVMDNTLNLADFTLYFSAVVTLTVSLSEIIGSIGEFNRLLLSLSSFKTFQKKQEVGSYQDANKELPSYEIVFSNVSFTYPNTTNPILKDINIVIPAGETLSLVGKNGAGKSTFIKLLCRFYRPTCGTITIGGVDIWEMGKKQYNELISAVFQDFQNFSFTIKENVAVGLDTENISQTLTNVGLGYLEDKLPEGVNTYLTRNFSSNGVELSGGESQKLAIARALYKETPIILLDEPTAALDAKAEFEIYDRFLSATKEKTTIFISHRLASSTTADRIVFFDNGRIAECGPHKELMLHSKEYAKMFEEQAQFYK